MKRCYARLTRGLAFAARTSHRYHIPYLMDGKICYKRRLYSRPASNRLRDADLWVPDPWHATLSDLAHHSRLYRRRPRVELRKITP